MKTRKHAQIENAIFYTVKKKTKEKNTSLTTIEQGT